MLSTFKFASLKTLHLITLYHLSSAYNLALANPTAAYNDTFKPNGSVRGEDGLLIAGVIGFIVMALVAHSQVKKGNSPAWYFLPLAVLVLFGLAIGLD